MHLQKKLLIFRDVFTIFDIFLGFFNLFKKKFFLSFFRLFLYFLDFLKIFIFLDLLSFFVVAFFDIFLGDFF